MTSSWILKRRERGHQRSFILQDNLNVMPVFVAHCQPACTVRPTLCTTSDLDGHQNRMVALSHSGVSLSLSPSFSVTREVIRIDQFCKWPS